MAYWAGSLYDKKEGGERGAEPPFSYLLSVVESLLAGQSRTNAEHPEFSVGLMS